MLSDEYPFARDSVIFHVFLHHFVLAKLATSSIRVKTRKDEINYVLTYIKVCQWFSPGTLGSVPMASQN